MIFMVNGSTFGECVKPARWAGPTLWSPVHLASSPHLRIGHTSITLSQDNFLRQPSNVLNKNDELPPWPFTLKRKDGLIGYDCGHYWSWLAHNANIKINYLSQIKNQQKNIKNLNSPLANLLANRCSLVVKCRKPDSNRSFRHIHHHG